MFQGVLISEGDGDSPLTDRLRTSWNLTVVPPSQAVSLVQQLRPILILVDNKVPDLPNLANGRIRQAGKEGRTGEEERGRGKDPMLSSTTAELQCF
ncbi:hypothetical protein WR25_22741 [Diploscapter pachys]|uniref:Uncharacterized protein n=1 Tax=Diploscapter pachys TaxID=2018661 RepID=A0A2A2KV39_9BILA|nr:hypothetical protein WR25_22741 [Diploscapter pachys]